MDIVECLYRANMVYVKDSSDEKRIEQRKYYQKEAYVNLKIIGYGSLMARNDV